MRVMQMMKKKGFEYSRTPVARVCAVWVAGALLAPAWALDLSQAYEAAERHDASIRASRAAADAAREKLPQAQAQRLPNVSFNAGANRNHLESQSPGMFGGVQKQVRSYDSNNMALQLRQPLYRPYVGALVQQAKAQLEEADASLERDEQNLVIRVAEVYFDALLARAQRDLIAAQKAAYAQQLAAAQKGFEAGIGVRTDIDEAQARVDMTHAQELEMAQHVEFTQRRMEALVGGPVQEVADLDMAAFKPQSSGGGLDEWIAQAEAASPQLRSLRAQFEASQREIDKAKAGHKPTLDAVAGWSRSDSDSVTNVNNIYNQKYIGLQLTVPLYGGGYVSSTVRQAVADSERARASLEAGRLELGVRVHEQYRAMTEGVLRIAALEQAARSAQQALESSRKSFAAGVRTSVDVLNAEQQHTTALRDLAQARYSYVLARIRLQSLAGQDRWSIVSQANAGLLQKKP